MGVASSPALAQLAALRAQATAPRLQLQSEIAQLEQRINEHRTIAHGLRNQNRLQEASTAIGQVLALEGQLAQLKTRLALLVG